MRFGIYLTWDAEAEAALSALRRKIAAEIEGVPSVEGKMAPHLSLLIFDGTLEVVGDIKAHFLSIAAEQSGFSVGLESIGAFKGRRSVICVEPLMTPELKGAYSLSLNALGGFDINPPYRDPDTWKPHITLTKGIRGPVFRRALALAEANWRPITATAAGMGIIDVQKPLEPLEFRTFEP